MTNFSIETAQNVSITQQVAKVSTRITAFLIDKLINIGYILIVYLILSSMDMLDYEELWIMFTLLGLPLFFYSLYFEMLMNGQTPGKYLTKIRVTNIDGSKPTFGGYIIRWITRLIEINLASGSLALLAILLNGKGQRLGDLAAGTTVISEVPLMHLSDTILKDIAQNYLPTYPQVTMLSDHDIQTIKEIFTDAKKRRKHPVIIKLDEKIKKMTGIKSNEKPLVFIETILKDYNYYTQQM
ncbi:MAG: RDD family protein [Flavobacteriaceae bacterium]|nr:RDD family protein [Flavobacteriaceae bacterium]